MKKKEILKRNIITIIIEWTLWSLFTTIPLAILVVGSIYFSKRLSATNQTQYNKDTRTRDKINKDIKLIEDKYKTTEMTGDIYKMEKKFKKDNGYVEVENRLDQWEGKYSYLKAWPLALVILGSSLLVVGLITTIVGMCETLTDFVLEKKDKRIDDLWFRIRRKDQEIDLLKIKLEHPEQDSLKGKLLN